MQKVCCIFNLEYLTQWAGAYFWLDELSKEVPVPRSPGPMWKQPPMFGQITELGFFEKINFLCFGRALKPFWTPQNLI